MYEALCIPSLIKCFSTIKVFPKTRLSELNSNEIFEFRNFLHSRMLIQNKLLIVFVIACLFCSAIVAGKSGECDVIQFNFTNLEGINNVLNFTKQNFPIKGKPVYYSLHGTKQHQNQTIIQWSDNTWIGQTRIYDEEPQKDFVPVFNFKDIQKHLKHPKGENWKVLGRKDNVVIQSRCLKFDNECIGETGPYDKVNNDPVKSRNECIFPFKHNNVEYNSCTMANSDGLWCATSIDTNLDWQTRGFCNAEQFHETCPIEGMHNAHTERTVNEVLGGLKILLILRRG